uniref:Uncharacterized protein n=1 Tax=Rangifer tarandus platyrhynchus TaxID=3082113 RepID=A0ACB0FGN7_RANTA|nr:unnamed protein product [Rangifer tarandus platyrhynchus]
MQLEGLGCPAGPRRVWLKARLCMHRARLTRLIRRASLTAKDSSKAGNSASLKHVHWDGAKAVTAGRERTQRSKHPREDRRQDLYSHSLSSWVRGLPHRNQGATFTHMALAPSSQHRKNRLLASRPGLHARCATSGVMVTVTEPDRAGGPVLRFRRQLVVASERHVLFSSSFQAPSRALRHFWE